MDTLNLSLFLTKMLKHFIIYHYTGILNLYRVSHGLQYINNKQRFSMYSPVIGASGAIASILGSFTFLLYSFLWIDFPLFL